MRRIDAWTRFLAVAVYHHGQVVRSYWQQRGGKYAFSSIVQFLVFSVGKYGRRGVVFAVLRHGRLLYGDELEKVKIGPRLQHRP
jgi:hypothetical protein